MLNKMCSRSPALLVVMVVLATSAPAPAQQAAVPAFKTPAASPVAKPVAKQAAALPASKAATAWRGQVMAHLNRQRRAFSSGPGGTATVTISIDRTGKVVAARVASSSGNPELDKEAVALAQRSSPLPAPPADVTGSRITLTAPVRFKQ
jgi:protein TonB